ncbi:MAG: tetratricopeptide repeat protein [Leptospirales bacterium]|nr:tetratricopeptide repeat protein [Leptospirales bacterium]
MKYILPIIFLLAYFPLQADAPSSENPMPDWAYYSHGVALKSEALASNDQAKMKKAIDYFLAAERSGVEIDRVQAHLADCYYYLGDNQKSIDYARKSISKNPQNPSPYNRLYLVYARLGDNEKAADILQEYCLLNPSALDTRFMLGEHYLKKMNNAGKSAEVFNSILAYEDDHPSRQHYREYACYYLGYISFQNGNLSDALKYYEIAYGINDKNLKTVNMLAMLYMEFLNLEKAEELSSLYLDTDPNHPVMNSVKGQTLYIRDDLSALPYLRRASKDSSIYGLLAHALYLEMMQKDEDATAALKILERYPAHSMGLPHHLAYASIYGRNENPLALGELFSAGVIAYKAKLPDVAKRCFNKIIVMNNKIAEAFYYLGKIYEDAKDYSLAILNYKKADELRPDIEMTLHIGYLYGLRQNYNEAFRHFAMVNSAQPDNALPYFYHGVFSIYNMDYKTAEKKLLRAVELDNKSESHYFYLAIAMQKNDKTKEALNYLEKAVELNPENAMINNYLGYLYADLNINIDRSLMLIRKALEKEPNNGAYIDSLGWVYFRKGMYTEALAELLRAEKQLDLDAAPDSTVYDHIGDVYDKLGNREQAINYWKKSLNLKEDKIIRAKLKEKE